MAENPPDADSKLVIRSPPDMSTAQPGANPPPDSQVLSANASNPDQLFAGRTGDPNAPRQATNGAAGWFSDESTMVGLLILAVVVGTALWVRLAIDNPSPALRISTYSFAAVISAMLLLLVVGWARGHVDAVRAGAGLAGLELSVLVMLIFVAPRRIDER